MRKRVTKKFTKKSLTQQHFKDECDVNIIVRRYSETGIVPHINTRTPSYGDFTSSEDYQTALNKLQTAQDEFMSLPSDIRQRFKNNPEKLITFLQDPNNQAEAIELGLINQPQQPVEVKLSQENLKNLFSSSNSGDNSEGNVHAKPKASS